MFDFLRRRRLLRRGLASKKTRRRRTRNELLRSPRVCILRKSLHSCRFHCWVGHFWIFSGQQPEPTKNFVMCIAGFSRPAIVQLWINRPGTFSQNSRVFLVFRKQSLSSSLPLKSFSSCRASRRLNFSPPEMGWLLAPYAFAPGWC